MGACQAAKREAIDGYTPAAYITYSTEEQHRCHHMVAVEVDAPAHICFDLWNDWNRLVDFLDLVTQVETASGQPVCLCNWGLRLGFETLQPPKPAPPCPLADWPRPYGAGHGALPVLLSLG